MATSTPIGSVDINHSSDDTDYASGSKETVLSCCCCKDFVRDPIMMSCLHNCCCACFDSNFTGKQFIECPSCSDSAKIEAAIPNSFLRSYLRVKALRAGILLCNACESKSNDGAPEAEAEYWCSDCCSGLCAECYSWHNRFSSRHRRSDYVEVAREWPLNRLLESSAQCTLHTRKLEFHCFSCCGPKCRECLTSCRASEHSTRTLTDDNIEEHVLRTAEACRKAQLSLRRLVDQLINKCKTLSTRLQNARVSNSRLLTQRRRMLLHSTEHAIDTSMIELFSDLQRIKLKRIRSSINPVDFSEMAASAVCRVRSRSTTTDLFGFFILCERRPLRAALASCTTRARSSGPHLLSTLTDSDTVHIDGSAPLTTDIVLSACLGTVLLRDAKPSSPLLFAKATISYQTSVECWDAAVTIDGRVLLAALQYGMFEYSEVGGKLSEWQPPMTQYGMADEVLSVEALSGERAAAGVAFAQVIVLLKRSLSDGVWQEENRITGLQSAPGRMSVQADLAVVTEYQPDSQQRWVRGRQLELARLSSRKLLYRQTREYDIWGVAVTALCVLTTSRGQVKVSNGVSSGVIDAYSHGGTLIWRYRTVGEETLTGVCSAGTWHVVYACLLRQGGSRVVAIGGADGSEIQHDVLRCEPIRAKNRPAYLSLASGHRRTMLAVLSFDKVSRNRRIVTLFEASK